MHEHKDPNNLSYCPLCGLREGYTADGNFTGEPHDCDHVDKDTVKPRKDDDK